MHQLDALAAHDHDRDEPAAPRPRGTSSVTSQMPASASSIARAIVQVMRSGAGPVRTRGGASRLEVTAPGDRAEVEADRAADAMITGRPATVSAAPTAIARFPPDGGMDAAVAAEPAPVRAEDVTSQTPPARDWLAEARARAAATGTTQATPVAAEPPRVERVLHRDPAVQDGVDRLSPILAEARASLREATPLFEQLPTDDPPIAGGHNRPMHEVVDAHDDARPIAPGTERAVRGSPAFMGASATLRARGANLQAAGHHARAALERNVAAQRRVEAVLARQRQGQAERDRAGAEASRDQATQGRAGELQDVQNAIRVLELGVGLLAGGVGASAAVSGAGATSITAGQAARTAATSTTAGIASNSLHDLAVGWVAERFVSEHWDVQIREANQRIATAAQAARTAGDQAAAHDLAAATADARAAEADVTSANQALVAARHEYVAAHHAVAGAAEEAAPGPGGRDAASHVSAATTAQVRVARLRRLRDAIRPPSAEDSRATQYAFPLWDRHTHRGNELIDVTARLLTMRAVTDRELGRWEHRLESLSNQVAHLGREE